MQQQPFYGGGYPGLGFDVSLGLPQSFSQTSLGSSLQSADLNSPEVFKQNIQTAQSHIVRVQSLARNALAGIEHAYHAGTNPLQTAADIADLKQTLHVLVEHLRQTGVGALPLEAPPLPDTRTDEQVVGEATRAVQALYERHGRMQDGAGVVAGLLAFQAGGAGAAGGGGSESQMGSQGAGVSQGSSVGRR